MNIEAIKAIRENFELWRKGEIKDGAFSWHLQNNLLRLESEINQSNHELDLDLIKEFGKPDELEPPKIESI